MDWLDSIASLVIHMLLHMFCNNWKAGWDTQLLVIEMSLNSVQHITTGFYTLFTKFFSRVESHNCRVTSSVRNIQRGLSGFELNYILS